MFPLNGALNWKQIGFYLTKNNFILMGNFVIFILYYAIIPMKGILISPRKYKECSNLKGKILERS